MNDIIIAVIGSLTTILTAIITGLLAKKEIKQREDLIPKETISEEKKRSIQHLNKSTLWKMISVVAFFIGIIFTVSFISIKHKWDVKNAIEKVNFGYNKLIETGINKSDGNPYILPAILMNAELERITDSSGSHLEANIFIVYNTVYLKSINKDVRAFDDFWRANRGGEVINLNGSDKEIMTAESPTSKAWNMIYPTNIGDNRMTVSHFKVIYPSNLKDYDSKFFGRLNSNEEEFAYPNSSNDVIGELVIMVSSSSLNFKLSEIHNAAVGSLNDLNPRNWIEPNLFTTIYGGKTFSTVVARFRSIDDNDVAKLKVMW